MDLLLLLHMPQQIALRPTPQHRQLSGIDALCPVFARVIDAQDTCNLLALGHIAGEADIVGHRGLLAWRRMKTAKPMAEVRAKIMFIPAIEIGRNDSR